MESSNPAVRRKEYLRKAAEAEIDLGRAQGQEAKASWERIVVGYLELADMMEKIEKA